MTVIKVDVDDQLIQEFGLKTVNDFMRKQIEHLRVRYLGKKVKEAIEESGIDHGEIVEKARNEAWQEFRQTHLKIADE